MKRIELPDGRIVDFPDDTPNEVIEQSLSDFIQQPNRRSLSGGVPDINALNKAGRSFFDPGINASFDQQGQPKLFQALDDPTPAQRFNLGDSPVSEVPVNQLGEAVLSTKEFSEDAGSFGDLLKQESLPMLGMGIGTAIAPGPGTALGLAAGEAAKQLGQRAGIIPGQPPETSGEAALDIGISGATGFIGGGVGKKAGQIGSKLARGASRDVTDEGRLALEFFENTGVVLNPARATDNFLLDIMSNASKVSLFGGSRFLRGELKAVDYVDNAITQLIQKSAGSKEFLGKLLKDAVENTLKTFKAHANQLYTRLDDAIGRELVNAKPIRSLVGELQRSIGKSPGLESLLNDLTKWGGKVLIGPDGLPRITTSFRQAQELRSILLDVTRGSSDLIKGQAKTAATRLEKILEIEMEKAANAAGPGFVKQWRRANQFWKAGRGRFDDTIIENIIKLDPDKAVTQLIAAGKDRVVLIRRMRRAIQDPKTLEALEGSMLQSFVGNKPITETAGAQLLSNIRKFGGFDGKALKAMFPRGQVKALQELAKIKNVVVKNDPSTPGRLAVQFGQVVAAGGVIGGGTAFALGEKDIGEVLGGISFGILITPALFAKALAHKGFQNFVIKGLKPKPGLKAAVQQATAMSAFLTKIGIEHELLSPQDSTSQQFPGLRGGNIQ